VKPFVLVSLLTDQQEYQRLQAAEATAAATQGGIDARVVFSKNDPALQIQQISDAIGAPEGGRPLAVVAHTAGSFGFERVARAALEVGVGWVLVNDSPRFLDNLALEYPGRLVAATCIQNEDVGRLLARMALKLCPEGGEVLTVEGPSAMAATLQRRRGIEEGLRGSKLRIVKTVTGDWTTAGAEKSVTSWLRFTGKGAVKPELILSLNDEMAEGALRAIQANRPDWGAVRAVGCDGLPEGGQRLVREGVLAGTLVVPATTAPGVQLAIKAWRGEQAPRFTAIPVHPYPPL